MTIKQLQLALSLFADDSNEDTKVVLLIDGKPVEINSVYLSQEGVEIVGE